MNKLTFIVYLILLISIKSEAQQQTAKSKESQIPLKDGKVFYEETDTLTSASKSDLYNKSKTWFVNTFNNAKAVIQLDDKEAGVVMGKGVTPFDAGNVVTGPLRNYIDYTININIKDNKYRIQVYDISVTNQNATYTPEYCLKYPKMNKKKLDKIDTSVLELIASFKEAMTKKPENF